MMNRRKFIKTAGVLVLGAPTAVLAAEVTLQWNSVVEADGYKLYWGTSSRLYDSDAMILAGSTARLNGQVVTVTEDTVVSSPLDVSSDTTAMIAITESDTYYFAVTAYNNYGESGYSEEVSEPILGGTGDIHNIRTVKFNVPPSPGGTKYVTFYLNLVYG